MEVVTSSTSFEFDTSVETASDAYARASSATSPEIPFALIITEPSRVSLEIANPELAMIHIYTCDQMTVILEKPLATMMIVVVAPVLTVVQPRLT